MHHQKSNGDRLYIPKDLRSVSLIQIELTVKTNNKRIGRLSKKTSDPFLQRVIYHQHTPSTKNLHFSKNNLIYLKTYQLKRKRIPSTPND